MRLVLATVILCFSLASLFFYISVFPKTAFIYLIDGVVITPDNTTFAARPANFGSLPPVVGSSHPLKGNLTFIEGFACEPIPTVQGIAVVQRGGCSFYQKVLSLQESGAIAVIVGNNVDSNLISMYTTNEPINVLIPSVFVSKHALEALREYTEASIAILPQTSSIMSSMALFVLSPLLSLGIVYAALAIQRYRDRLRLRAPRQAVEALPVKMWEELDHNPIAIRDCAICIEDFNKTCKVMILPCGHGFHPECISRWLLTERRFCPICRQDVETGKPQVSSAEEAPLV